MTDITIVDSLKDRDFNDDGIPDMYLEEGPSGKKQFAWTNPEAKAVWDKYIRYDKQSNTYFLDSAAVMVDQVKAMERQTAEIRRVSDLVSTVCVRLRELGDKIAKIKISIF